MESNYNTPPNIKMLPSAKVINIIFIKINEIHYSVFIFVDSILRF